MPFNTELRDPLYLKVGVRQRRLCKARPRAPQVQHDTSGEFRVLGVGRDFEGRAEAKGVGRVLMLVENARMHQGHELVLGDASA